MNIFADVFFDIMSNIDDDDERPITFYFDYLLQDDTMIDFKRSFAFVYDDRCGTDLRLKIGKSNLIVSIDS